MIYPPYLGSNSTIGICAPSAGVGHKLESFDQSEQVLRAQGWHIKETAHVRVDDMRGGTAAERAEELRELFTDPEVHAVFVASGGDFLDEMLPYVDWDVIRQNPKWLMGASDPTGLLFPCTTLCDVATLYGSNAGSFDTLVREERDERDESAVSENTAFNDEASLKGRNQSEGILPSYLRGTLAFLKGQSPVQTSWDRHLGTAPFLAEEGPLVFDAPTEYRSNRNALHTEGRCLGGCIDVLKDLIGTPFDGTQQFLSRYAQDGVIWYFDNFSLSSAVLYRTLLQLRYAGWLAPAHTRAVLIGRTLFETVESELSYEDAIRTALSDLPVVWEADIGHTIPHFFMVNGARLHLDWAEQKMKLRFELV